MNFFLQAALWSVWTLLIPGISLQYSKFYIIPSLKTILSSFSLNFLDFPFLFAFLFFLFGFFFLIFSIRGILLEGLLFPPAQAPVVETINLDTADAEEAENARSYRKVRNSVRRVLIFVNPVGGAGRSLAVMKEKVLPILKSHHIESIILETQYSGHAYELSSHYSYYSIDCLIVLGGDGSIKEILNGLKQRENREKNKNKQENPPFSFPPLVPIPTGTGNNFARDCGIFTVEDALERILYGFPIKLDLNLLKDGDGAGPLSVYSINEISFGLIGDVGLLAEKLRFFSHFRYDLAAVWLILTGKFYWGKCRGNKIKRQQKAGKLVEIRKTRGKSSGKNSTSSNVTEEEFVHSGPFVTIFINSTQCFGGGLRASPQAQLNDGLFDCLILEQASRSQLFTLFSLIASGRHLNYPGIQYFQGNSIELSMGDNEKGMVNIDGENHDFHGKLRISCEEKAFAIFTIGKDKKEENREKRE